MRPRWPTTAKEGSVSDVCMFGQQIYQRKIGKKQRYDLFCPCRYCKVVGQGGNLLFWDLVTQTCYSLPVLLLETVADEETSAIQKTAENTILFRTKDCNVHSQRQCLGSLAHQRSCHIGLDWHLYYNKKCHHRDSIVTAMKTWSLRDHTAAWPETLS